MAGNVLGPVNISVFCRSQGCQLPGRFSHSFELCECQRFGMCLMEARQTSWSEIQIPKPPRCRCDPLPAAQPPRNNASREILSGRSITGDRHLEDLAKCSTVCGRECGGRKTGTERSSSRLWRIKFGHVGKKVLDGISCTAISLADTTASTAMSESAGPDKVARDRMRLYNVSENVA
jgi:hypothetical protein